MSWGNEWHRIKQWQRRIHKNNVDHGFVHTGEHIHRALLMAIGEIVEAQNELRAGHSPRHIYHNLGEKPEGFGIEIADAIIRLLDIAEGEGIDMEHCMELKHEYNVTRPFKHGKAF